MIRNIDIGSAVGVASAATRAITKTARRQELTIFFAVMMLAKLSKTRTTGRTKAIPKTNKILSVKRMYSLALITFALPSGVKPISVRTKPGREIQASATPVANSGKAVNTKARV